MTSTITFTPQPPAPAKGPGSGAGRRPQRPGARSPRPQHQSPPSWEELFGRR